MYLKPKPFDRLGAGGLGAPSRRFTVADELGDCAQLAAQLLRAVERFNLHTSSLPTTFDVAQLRAFSEQATKDAAAAADGTAGGAAGKTTEAGRFEWVDGKFLEAVEHGGWVILDNVNLCEPTVLDRLNPLFEPGGVLQVSCLRLRGLLVCVRADGGCVHHLVQVNEQGLLDGAVRTITPHPEFRLFMVPIATFRA